RAGRAVHLHLGDLRRAARLGTVARNAGRAVGARRAAGDPDLRAGDARRRETIRRGTFGRRLGPVVIRALCRPRCRLATLTSPRSAWGPCTLLASLVLRLAAHESLADGGAALHGLV